MTQDQKCFKLQREAAMHGITWCEMCPSTKNWPPRSVHHILGKDEPWKFDLRSVIVLCHRCHEFYQDNTDGLLADMTLRVGVPQGQAEWIARHRYDKHKGPWNVDKDERFRELKEMHRAILAGEKTRDDFRQWSE